MWTYEGYEWTEEEEENFEVDALVGRLVADGTTRYANQGVASAGTVLYRVVWSGFPADLLWVHPAVSEVKGKESMLQWLLKCLSKPRPDYLQTRANCRSGSLYLPELLIAHA